jgi:hypothetical protein
MTNCPKSCSCICHSATLTKFPRWMNQVTGLLFMRYSGKPLLTAMKCTKKRCKGRHQSKIHASYYFPGWMLHRMVEVVATWDANAAPAMSLRVMRIIPDQSPLFSYSMEGRTVDIQDLFLQNLASPIDIRESAVDQPCTSLYTMDTLQRHSFCWTRQLIETTRTSTFSLPLGFAGR